MADENPTPTQPMSLRERILASDDIDSELLHVPQWDVKVEIRGMTAKERSGLLKRAMKPSGDVDYEILYPLLVVATTYDPESGEQVFTKDDYEALNNKSGAALELIGSKAAEISGLTEEATNALGEGSSPVTGGSTAAEDSPLISQSD